MNPQSPDLKKCYYCDKPEETPRAAVCFDHRRCSICAGLMQGPEVYSCVKNDEPPTHARCLIASRPDRGEDSVTVHRRYLDKLNQARLLITPEPDLNEESNVNTAALRAGQFIVDMTLEEQFLFMRRLEAAAAEISHLIGKNRATIKEELIKKAGANLKEAQDYRSGKIERPKPAKNVADLNTTPKGAPKPKDPREKAIAGLMAMGISRDKAIVMIGG